MTRLSLVSDAIVEPTLLGIIAFNHLLGFSISFFDRHQRFVHDLYLCIEFCTYLVNFCILLLQCCQVLLILGYCSVRHSTFSHLTDMAFHTFEEHATFLELSFYCLCHCCKFLVDSTWLIFNTKIQKNNVHANLYHAIFLDFLSL